MNKSKLICVQGLGFVGAAMLAAVSLSKSDDNREIKLIGVDLDNEEGNKRIESINNGIFPFKTSDIFLEDTLKSAVLDSKIFATSNQEYFRDADIIVSSINLDLITDGTYEHSVGFDEYLRGIRSVASRIREDALFIVESTVPPGTCSKIIKPIFDEEFKKRGFSSDPKIAHSYERVMPGENYLFSIINYWRVYSGLNQSAKNECKSFLSSFINTTDFPLTELESTEASEIAKVLENTYRAVNIALINEWTVFSERLGVDLFKVLEAIRMRPTHVNIMNPGLGVGGYCLTKDPLFVEISADKIFNFKDLSFPFSHLAFNVNDQMPIDVINRFLKRDMSLSHKRVLLLGVTYKPNVADTRFSPTLVIYKSLLEHGSIITVHDPLVSHWREAECDVTSGYIDLNMFDVIILTVKHKIYESIDFKILKRKDTIIFDLNNVLTEKQYDQLSHLALKFYSVGRGENLW